MKLHSDLSQEELKQPVAELEAEKKKLQQQRDKTVAQRALSSEHVEIATAEEPMELAGGPTSFLPTSRYVLNRFENMLVLVDGDG